MKNRTPQLVALIVVLAIAGGVFADYWTAEPLDVSKSFVGRSSCVECHKEEAEKFVGSHHDLAMDLATSETVLGDFDDVTFEHDGLQNRLYRDGDKFMVRTEGPTGEMEDFEVKYVFGVTPLQQYMVEFDRTPDMPQSEIARLQVLRISWDTEAKKWFYLRPPDVPEKLEPDDPLHWTGVMQRWQTMCADCHSTNLKRNFDVDSLQYHTTFSEIDVSCEACHGPGSLHIELANKRSLFWDRNHGYGLAKLKGDDPEPQIQACAPCHSRRGVLDPSYVSGDSYHDGFALELLQPHTYHADGQIKDEVYVYGSFIQSKMYHKGIRCTDCHDPHSLKLKKTGNETCTSCHQHAAGKYDVPSHHHHAPGTAGAMCVNCHMPHTTYMEVDPRRDHSLRVPRPDLSVQLGTPNACSSCHVKDQLKSLDADKRKEFESKDYALWLQAADSGDESIKEAVSKTDSWCDEACEKWYGENRKQPDHFATPLAAYRSGDDSAAERLLRLAVGPTDQAPAIAKATILSDLAQRGQSGAIKAATEIARDVSENPMVRAAAMNLFMNARFDRPAKYESFAREHLMPLLKDDSRLVRNEAARVLASAFYPALDSSAQTQVDLTLRELKESIMHAADRGGAHMNWAMLCESMGRFDEALRAYETAITVEPQLTGARSNLAGLLERSIPQTPRSSVHSIRQRIKTLRQEELGLLKRDAGLAPDNAEIQYRYGLSLYLNQRQEEALDHLQKSAQQFPDDFRFGQAIELLKQEIDKAKKAQGNPKE